MIRHQDEEEIQRRLFQIKYDLRAEVVKECGDDFLKREKYFADLLECEDLGDLDGDDWPLARFLKTKMYDVAKSDPYPLDARRVWQVFRHTFFGRNNLFQAEIIARLLLWKLALTIEGAEMSPEEEQVVIAHISNMHDLESLTLPHQYRSLTNKLLDVFNQNKGYYGRKNDNQSTVNIEVWYRFRHLLRKHRSQFYTTL